MPQPLTLILPTPQLLSSWLTVPDEAILPEDILAIFAVQISQLAHTLAPSDLKPSRAMGLSDRAILKAAEIATQFGLYNRLTKAFSRKVCLEYDRLFS
ncbi:MAG TPA: hypothetical protein V6D20_18745 [Candidatus Obscuribacterales bacterium]